MSSTDYNGTWVNGTKYSLGAERFAGQTRDRLQPDGTILRTTYGFHTIHGTKLVATISERVKVGFVVPKKQDYIDKMLNQAFYESGWSTDD
jgi:hypothetical protein